MPSLYEDFGFEVFSSCVKNCHETLNQFRLLLLSIRGFDHQSYTVLLNKVVLNNFYSKMYIFDCTRENRFSVRTEKTFCVLTHDKTVPTFVFGRISVSFKSLH